MHVSDEDFLRLTRMDEAGARSWLRHRQPAAGDGDYWWESVMTRALQAMYQAETRSDRSDFARLARAATEEAMDQATIGPAAGVIRLANGATAYFAAEQDGDEFADIDSIVARCLDLIEPSIDIAVHQTQDWTQLPVAEIRALRNAKNLVSSCAPLRHRVTDRRLADQLSAWIRVLDDLP